MWMSNTKQYLLKLIMFNKIRELNNMVWNSHLYMPFEYFYIVVFISHFNVLVKEYIKQNALTIHLKLLSWLIKVCAT